MISGIMEVIVKLCVTNITNLSRGQITPTKKEVTDLTTIVN